MRTHVIVADSAVAEAAAGSGESCDGNPARDRGCVFIADLPIYAARHRNKSRDTTATHTNG